MNKDNSLYSLIQRYRDILGKNPTKEEIKKSYEVKMNSMQLNINSLDGLPGQERLLREQESNTKKLKELKEMSEEEFQGYIKIVLEEEEKHKEEIKKNLENMPVEEEREKEKIHLPGLGKHISTFADELVKYLKDKDKLFFRKDIREVVEITEEGFEIVKPTRFITIIERYFDPYVFIEKKGVSSAHHKSLGQQTSRVVLDSPNFQDEIKTINRIFPVAMPILYEGKLTLPSKGHDERFSSWLDYNSPNINKDISIEEAKEKILEIYEEFCFQDEQDKINAIAGLITPFLKGLFSRFNVRVPMFSYMANRERAGKDYCAGITGIVLEGENSEETPISSGEFNSSGGNDELRKKLVSALISGKKRMHFANNKGKLNNAVLEGFLTQPTFSDRLLGKNELVHFKNELDISISGNIGMTFTPDLANRSRFINLFLDIEDANKRKFKNPNLHESVLKDREYILSCIYALIRNWFDNDMPKGSIKFASYPEWAEICGGIMECANLGNPCIKDESVQGIGLDEETEEMKNLFEYMNEVKPNEWLNKTSLKQYIKNTDDLFVYIDWDRKADQTKFGKKLNRYVGRILSNIKLTVKDRNIRTQRWEYKFEKIISTYKKEQDGHIGHIGHQNPLVEISEK
jgi:hypothetical protein